MTSDQVFTPSGPDDQILRVQSLSISFSTSAGLVPVVTDASFKIGRGRTLGLVGESGCGKSVSSLALINLLPAAARIVSGSVEFDGTQLVGLSRKRFEQIRGRDIGFIFQDAMRCLNPSLTVGTQIAEVTRKHLGLDKRAAHRHAIEMLSAVGISRPSARVDDYPHTFSGGMAQRVMIAMALACQPKLLIADEPTTALDVTIQKQILALLNRLQDAMGLSILFITHDLAVVAEMCDDVAVMYAGQIVEQSPADELFGRPAHPYTEGLLAALPRIHERAGSFSFIPGRVPSPSSWPDGCRFASRCGYVEAELCSRAPIELADAGARHRSRCVRSAGLALRGIRPINADTPR